MQDPGSEESQSNRRDCRGRTDIAPAEASLRVSAASAICKIDHEPQASRGTRLPQVAGATGLFTYFQTPDLMTDADFVAAFKVLAQVATGRSDHLSGVESGACSTRVGV